MNRSRETDKPQKETERQMPKDMRGGKIDARERERAAEKEWQADKQTMTEKHPKEMGRWAGKQRHTEVKRQTPEERGQAREEALLSFLSKEKHMCSMNEDTDGYEHTSVFPKLGKRNLSLPLFLSPFLSLSVSLPLPHPSLTYSSPGGRAESALCILKSYAQPEFVIKVF